MAEILIANDSDGSSLVKELMLKPRRHRFSIATTMSAGEAMIRHQVFDLIIIGVHFDGSRMFEFLAACKNNANNQRQPIICLCSRDTHLLRLTQKSIADAATALGAEMYFDQYDYQRDVSPSVALADMIEHYLAAPPEGKIKVKGAPFVINKDGG